VRSWLLNDLIENENLRSAPMNWQLRWIHRAGCFTDMLNTAPTRYSHVRAHFQTQWYGKLRNFTDDVDEPAATTSLTKVPLTKMLDIPLSYLQRIPEHALEVIGDLIIGLTEY